MTVSKPSLPPMEGYVEIIDENGNHIYKKLNDFDSWQKNIWTIL